MEKPRLFLRTRLARWGRRLAIGMLLAAPIGVVTVWMFASHIPSWYRPAIIAPHEQQKVRDDFESAFNTMSDNVMKPLSFEVVLGDGQVTRWLAMRGRMLPEAENWLPNTLLDPAVHFDGGVARVAATISRGEYRAVASIGFSVRVDHGEVRVRPVSARLGSLRIPIRVAWWLLSQFEETRMPLMASDAGSGDEGAGRVESIAEGFRFENRLHWKNGDRYFRVAGVEVRDHAMRLTIEPLQSR
jgi:hypothetical protein